MQIPYRTLISLDKNSSIPLYIQLSNAIIQHIQAGILKPETKLLGSRPLADLLAVHRKTVIAAYDELLSQGWIEVFPQKGTFIARNIPQILPQRFLKTTDIKKEKSNIESKIQPKNLRIPVVISKKLALNDGLPDARLAPREELSKLYTHYVRYGDSSVFRYANIYGNEHFREVLAKNLNETRGLNISAANLVSTRGSQMGIYLAGLALLQKGDIVVVGELSYRAANITFEALGAKLLSIPIDEDGLVVDALAEICERALLNKQVIKAIYVTSHHYHPTTVTLKPDRRIKLLALAEKYHFFIIEDDYDYDFHFANSPILPLASADKQGWVIYIGSFTKRIAPVFRVGYVAGNEAVIKEMAKLRGIIDRQGDTILELCLADLLENGVLKRYSTKALKIYRERRDFTCELLKAELSDVIDFKIPNGGMAIWANFDKTVPLQKLSEIVAKNDLHISDGQTYSVENQALNACRIGFAAMNKLELEEAVGILKKGVLKLKNHK